MGNAQKPPVERIQEAATPVLLALTRGDAHARDQLEDLLSTVTAKVLGRLTREPPVEDLEHYVKQVARNAFNDWLRHKQRHPEDLLSDGSLSNNNQLPQTTPSSLAVRRDDQRRHAAAIREVMERLSGAEQAVLRLRYGDGLSAAEVAAQLGYKSAAVVDTIAARARKKLAERLPQSLIDKVAPRPPAPPAVRRR